MKSANSTDGTGNHIPSFAERINRLTKKRRELIRPSRSILAITCCCRSVTWQASLARIRPPCCALSAGWDLAAIEISKSIYTNCRSRARRLWKSCASIRPRVQYPLARPQSTGTGYPQSPCAAQHPRHEKRVADLGQKDPSRPPHPHSRGRSGHQSGGLSGIPVDSAWFPRECRNHTGACGERRANCGKKDLVIAISFRRGLRQTVEGLQQAHANGAYCVALPIPSFLRLRALPMSVFLPRWKRTSAIPTRCR